MLIRSSPTDWMKHAEHCGDWYAFVVSRTSSFFGFHV